MWKLFHLWLNIKLDWQQTWHIFTKTKSKLNDARKHTFHFVRLAVECAGGPDPVVQVRSRGLFWSLSISGWTASPWQPEAAQSKIGGMRNKLAAQKMSI